MYTFAQRVKHINAHGRQKHVNQIGFQEPNKKETPPWHVNDHVDIFSMWDGLS